jgi:hypothetical protein
LTRRDEANTINDVTVNLGSVWVDLAFNPDTCSGSPGSSSNFWSFASVYGDLSGNTFTGSKDYASYGITYHDEVTVNFNPDHTMASVQLLRARYDPANSFIDTLTISATDIPATTPDYGFDRKYLRQGADICSNAQIYYRRIDDDVPCDYIIDNYSCDQFTQLVIHMR